MDNAHVTAAHRPPRARFTRHLVPALAAAWLIGAIVKDRTPVTVLPFYIPAVLVVVAGVGWLLWGSNQSPRWLRAFVAAVTLLSLAKVAWVDVALSRPTAGAASTTGQPIRIVHWNVARGRLRSSHIAEVLAADRPDVCVLSESPAGAWVDANRDRVIAGGHQHVEFGLTVWSRFAIERREGLAGPGLRGYVVAVAAPQPFDLVCVDMASSPFGNRRRAIEPLSIWLSRRGDHPPLVLLGDFNTPRDSVHFVPWRLRLSHAYESAGGGWPYTWPWPLPLWSIDHAWTSPGLRVTDYRLRAAACSDHLRQVIDLTVESASP